MIKQFFIHRVYVVIFAILAFNCKPLAQEVVYMTFGENVTKVEGDNNLPNMSIFSKEQRTNSRNSRIEIHSEFELSDDLNKALGYASALWENCIKDFVKTNVEVKFIETMQEDIRVDVGYIVKDNLMYPTALKAYIDKECDREFISPDGIITINASTDWDYGLNENINPKGKNLTFCLLRAFARIFGFGSDVLMKNNNSYYFCNRRYHSLYDTLVEDSNGVFLSSIGVNAGSPSNELKEYIETPGKTFWVDTYKTKYRLKSPPYDMSQLPFNYLDDEGSLMRKEIEEGSYIFRIDEATEAVMCKLGWNMMELIMMEIVSDDVPKTGLVSAYENHTFRLSTANKNNISFPTWTLFLPLNNGEEEIINLRDQNMSCTVPAIIEEKKYATNIDGDIRGRLVFSGVINGVRRYSQPFNIFFELKPLIISAKIENIIENVPNVSYDLTYSVSYRGSDRLKISVEEEYSSKLKSQLINEPYVIHGTIKNINSKYKVWIDFTAENSYGKGIYTIPLLPGGTIVRTNVEDKENIDKEVSKVSSTTNQSFPYYRIFDISGYPLGLCFSQEEIEKIEYKGLVIIQEELNNEIIGLTKRILK